MDRTIFRRHENCRCSVEYDPANGSRYRHDVWSKKWKQQSSELDYMAKGGIRHIIHKPKEKVDIKIVCRDKKYQIYSETNDINTQKVADQYKKFINSGANGLKAPKKVIITRNSNLGGIAAYSYEQDTLYLSRELSDESWLKKEIGTRFPLKNVEDCLTHELTHKRHWDKVKELKEVEGFNSLEDAKQYLEERLRQAVKEEQTYDPFAVKKIISENAFDNLERSDKDNRLNELIADGNVLIQRGSLKSDKIKQALEELLS